MSRDHATYVADMLEACERIMSYTPGASAESLAADRKTLDAVIRNLQVIGEAAKRIPDSIRALASRRLAGLVCARDKEPMTAQPRARVAVDRVVPTFPVEHRAHCGDTSDELFSLHVAFPGSGLTNRATFPGRRPTWLRGKRR